MSSIWNATGYSNQTSTLRDQKRDRTGEKRRGGMAQITKKSRSAGGERRRKTVISRCEIKEGQQ